MIKKFTSIILTIIIATSCIPFAMAGLLGDADENGVVNSTDALTVLQYVVRQKNTINKSEADVNCDGKINSSDSLAILQLIVNKASKVKAGFIFLNDADSEYDKSFISAASEACVKLGVSCIRKFNISDSDECYRTAVELVNKGCNFIFADSPAHETYLLSAAKNNPKVHFVCAGGTLAHSEKLSNFHNAYASISDGRYLTGVAAGLKLNEMISANKFTKNDAKLGFVSSYAPDIISAYTAFFLGAKSVCPTVKMDVQLIGNGYNKNIEKTATQKLINSKCKVISQYTNSIGVSECCEQNNIPNVTFGTSVSNEYPETSLITSRINWVPYLTYALNCMINSKSIQYDYCGSLKDGSVVVEGLNSKIAAAGTQSKIDSVKNSLINGTVHAFSASAFSVNGKTLNTYKADVDTDSNYTEDTEVISNGYFHESQFRSAPYFDIKIDGITPYVSTSPIATYANITNDRNSFRNHCIDTITIHCYVGQVTAKEGCDYFKTSDRSVSANYVVGKDGSIGTSVYECDRAWTSSSRFNDNRAVTIEVASDTTSPYAITDAAYNAPVNLCADICKRNGIKKLLWKNDSSLIGEIDKQNMTVHRWFASTDCPGQFLMNHMSDIASKANAKIK